MLIIKESVSIAAKISLYTSNSKVHGCKFPCRRIALLTKNCNIVSYTSSVLFYKICTLDKHAARTTTGIIDASMEWLNDLNKCSYNTARGIEFTSKLSFLFCKFSKAVLVSTTKNIYAVFIFCKLNVCE